MIGKVSWFGYFWTHFFRICWAEVAQKLDILENAHCWAEDFFFKNFWWKLKKSKMCIRLQHNFRKRAENRVRFCILSEKQQLNEQGWQKCRKMFLHANMDSARQIPDIYVFSETTDSICAAEIAFRFLKKKYWELTTFFWSSYIITFWESYFQEVLYTGEEKYQLKF